MSICLLDTSVFVELLNVPNMNAHHAVICAELKQKIEDKESLFLPMATILETGNHIAQNGDGTQRRKCADYFVNQIQHALDGVSPFTPLVFPTQEVLQLCGDCQRFLQFNLKTGWRLKVGQISLPNREGWSELALCLAPAYAASSLQG